MRLYPAIFQPTCLHSVHLGLNAVFQPASNNHLINVIKSFRKRIPSACHVDLTSAPYPGLSPLLYHNMQPRHVQPIQYELFELLLRYQPFNIEIIPRYVATRGGFQIGLEFRHDIFEEIKSALSHWGGSCASASYTMCPTEEDRRGTFTFSPFHTSLAEDVEETRNSLRVLNDILARTGNKVTTKSFLLQEIHTFSSNTNQSIRPIMEFHLSRPKNNIQAQLVEMRRRTRKESTILANKCDISDRIAVESRSRHQTHLENIITPATPIRQVHIRRIGVLSKYKYTDMLRKKYTETVFCPEFLRRVKIRKSPISGPAYRVIDFMIARAPEPISGVVKIKPPRTMDLLNQTSADVGSNRMPESPIRITRDQARKLEVRKRNRPLVRFYWDVPLVRYFHRDFDP